MQNYSTMEENSGLQSIRRESLESEIIEEANIETALLQFIPYLIKTSLLLLENSDEESITKLFGKNNGEAIKVLTTFLRETEEITLFIQKTKNENGT